MKSAANLAVLLLVCVPLSAQAPRDFSGTWRLDAAQSNPPLRNPANVILVVQQTADQLTMERKVGDKSTVTTYALDGSRREFVSSVGRHAVGKASWDKDKLLIEGGESTPNGGTLVLKVCVEAAPDGTTLSVTEVRDTGSTSFTLKQVYSRESAR